ncbi:MAG: porin [Chitinophagales bacterium]
MKKHLLFMFLVCTITTGVLAQTEEGSFNPTIKVKALVHSRYDMSLTDSVDISNKYSDDALMSNFRMRRIEMRSDMKLTEKWSGVVRIQLPELKGSSPGKVIELAYVQYKHSDALQIMAGQFKVPYELDELTSHEDLRMIERGTTSSLIVSQSLASYQPGIMIFGKFMKETTPLNYYFAIVNGSNRAVNNDINDQKNVAGRLEYSFTKGIRLGVNAQQAFAKDESSTSYGVDLSIQQKLSDKTKLIVEGEYIVAPNVNAFLADTSGLDFSNFDLSGYFGQALLRFDINKSWCRTFEVGGKYETTDPLTDVDGNSFSTITGTVGFIFLPDNDARLQFNIIHTDWESAISPGGIMASNIFSAQFQVKI